MEEFKTESCEHLKSAKFVVKLGQGVLGSVKLYQCKMCHKSEVCNELIVVKSFYESSRPNKETTKRKELLTNEYLLGMIVNHEYIIKTHGMNADDGFLLLEHCPGEDLFDYLCRKENLRRTDMTIFAPLFLQILEAVSYLHSIGIAHVDLKLENIMLDFNTNKIKLIDFGHSGCFIVNNERVPLSEAKGTVEYLPPEMFCNTKVFGDHIDIWSIGVVFYSLIYNRALWSCASFKDPIFKKCNRYFEDFKLPPNIFMSPKLVGYDEHDSFIIEKIFIMIFCERINSIQPILDLFKTLHVFD